MPSPTHSTRALVVARGARAALQDGRRGRIVLGGYIQLGDDFVLLGGPRAPVGPLSVLVARPPGLPVGTPARCSDGLLLLGGVLGVDSNVPERRGRVAEPTRAGYRDALAAALAVVPSPPAALHAGLWSLRADELATAVARLGGRGEGLTPAGDDVLAGYAAWRHTEGRPVAISGDVATTPLSLAYLRRAELGELPDAAVRVRDAIRRGDIPASRAAARALSAWGASSGFALLWGMAAATALGPGVASGRFDVGAESGDRIFGVSRP